VLGIHERCQAAGLLCLGDDLQRDGGLTRALRPEDLNEIEPVEITAIGPMASFAPRRMTDPLPNCFSSCERAVSIALLRSSATIVISSVGVTNSDH
jgi:hypothetical protein